ncbi:MAG: NUDIX hydrolase [Lysobacterales bacterium]
MNQPHAFHLSAALSDFRRRHARQSATVDAFLALLGDPGDAFSRRRREGHFTGSAFVVSRDGLRVLLTQHRKLDRWLQLGGHADGNRDLAAVALREAQEESGIEELELEPELFDIDLHDIPARGEEIAHQHFDARFIVRAGENERFVVSDESHELAWWLIDDVTRDPRIDASLQRMAQRWMEITRDGWNRGSA